MEAKEFVSIIVPTLNCEKFIKKTIESILNQTYQFFEILIIDDCSTDNTLKCIYSFSDKRIKLFKNKKQSGAAFSRNRGLALATGEYVAFLDGDDLWHKEKLEHQISFMKENNYDFSCTDYDEIDEEDNKKGIIVSGTKVMNHKTFLKADYVGCLTVVFRRNIYPDLSIPESIYKRNDYALWLKLSERVKCYRLNEVLASYRKTSGSVSSGKKIRLLKYHKELFEKLYGFRKVKSSFYALRNAIHYIFKRIRYVKRKKI